MNCSTLHCVELSDGDFPLDFTNTNFEGHYGSLQLIGMGPPSENLTQVPAGAINGVTFDTVFILQFITIGSIYGNKLHQVKKIIWILRIFHCVRSV